MKEYTIVYSRQMQGILHWVSLIVSIVLVKSDLPLWIKGIIFPFALAFTAFLFLRRFWKIVFKNEEVGVNLLRKVLYWLSVIVFLFWFLFALFQYKNLLDRWLQQFSDEGYSGTSESIQ